MVIEETISKCFKLCECGCNESIPVVNKLGKLSRFKRGHNSRIDHPNWKGGRVMDADGYILIMKTDHPNATRDGYVREHRLIMEQQIGRYLLPDEDVHHINENRQDNRIENLRLMSHADHKGHHAKGNRYRRREYSYHNIRNCRAGIRSLFGDYGKHSNK